MPVHFLFDAFSGLAALLAPAVLAALFLCTRENDTEVLRHEWTLRPRARRH